MRNHFANICRQPPDSDSTNSPQAMAAVAWADLIFGTISAPDLPAAARAAASATPWQPVREKTISDGFCSREACASSVPASNTTKGTEKCMGGGDHRRFRHAAIQRGNTGQPVAIDPSHRQRLFRRAGSLRRTACRARSQGPSTSGLRVCLIADIQLHHKTRLPSRTITMRRGLRQPQASKRSGQHRMKPPDWVGRTGRSFSPP
jgi:hypothetical protein